jgi:hypothetical protein
MEAPMKTETPQRIHRQDYTPPPFLVDQVELDVQFHRGEVLVSSQLRLRRNPAAVPGQALQLDGHGLETISLAIDGSPARRRRLHLQRLALTIANPPDTLTLSTLVRIDADHNTSLSGLYRSKDGYFTQCEAQGFRSITWFPDRPDIMSRYRHPARRQGQPAGAAGQRQPGRQRRRRRRPPLGALGRSLCQALLSLRAGRRPPRRAARPFHHRQRSPASSSLSSSSPASSTSARTRWTPCSARCAGTRKSSDSNATSTTT